ncbi:hypothetical protein BDZ89DRAFT_1161636, partial [Hymenopellis radicata]
MPRPSIFLFFLPPSHCSGKITSSLITDMAAPAVIACRRFLFSHHAVTLHLSAVRRAHHAFLWFILSLSSSTPFWLAPLPIYIYKRHVSGCRFPFTCGSIDFMLLVCNKQCLPHNIQFSFRSVNS